MKLKFKKILCFVIALCMMMTSFHLVDVKAAKKQAKEKSKDIVLVLDTSGSMQGKAITSLKEAAVNFCENSLDMAEEFSTKVQIGIVTINSYSTKVLDLTDNLSDMKSKINALSAYGGTDLYSAIKAADDMLNASSAEGKYMVIMTDGLPEHGQKSATGLYTSYDNFCYQQANACINLADPIKKANKRIFTIGFFGSMYPEYIEFGKRFLKDLASEEFYVVEKLNDLEVVFDKIKGGIIDPKEEQTLSLNISDGTEIEVGSTKQIKVTGCKTNLSYSSADETIATVDDSGVITGVMAGEIEITVKADENDKYKQAWVSVNVKVVPKKEKPAIKEVKKTGNRFSIKLTSATKGITGYEIKYSNGTTEKVEATGTTITGAKKIATSTTTRGIGGSKNKAIKVQVRTYTITRGKTYYGPWSNAVSE